MKYNAQFKKFLLEPILQPATHVSEKGRQFTRLVRTKEAISMRRKGDASREFYWLHCNKRQINQRRLEIDLRCAVLYIDGQNGEP